MIFPSRVTVLSRSPSSSETSQRIRAMDVGQVICIPQSFKLATMRGRIYTIARDYKGKRKWRTHNTPQGLFVERWL